MTRSVWKNKKANNCLNVNDFLSLLIIEKILDTSMYHRAIWVQKLFN